MKIIGTILIVALISAPIAAFLAYKAVVYQIDREVHSERSVGVQEPL